MSGQVIFLSSTNSALTGGYFSQTPGIRGLVSVSKGGFVANAVRNSDLMNPDSRANFNMINSSYTKTFGNFSAAFATELYIFDKHIDFDFIVPMLTLNLKGAVNLEFCILYGYTFRGNYDDLFSQRLAISKDYAGFTFKLTGWNVNFGTHRQALAFEVSTKLSERIRLFVSGNMNHIYETETTQKFGVVRLAYSF